MVRLVPEASALNERSYLYSTHVLDPSVAPQIISAAAVLSGVVLTLLLTHCVSDGRIGGRQSATQRHARRIVFAGSEMSAVQFMVVSLRHWKK
jgi:hypothetical protein